MDPAEAPLSSGVSAIDAALSIGGFPRGRITEIYGASSSGKTTIALHTVAACQRQGGTAAFIDADHAFDPAYAARLGVDLEALILAQPGTGEQGLDIARALAASFAVDLVVIDSAAALVPRVELDGEAAALPNLHRRLLMEHLRGLAFAAARGRVSLLVLNQMRRKSGDAGGPDRPTGGPALGLRAAIRAEVRAIAPLYAGTALVGRRTVLRVVKNSLGVPFLQAEFDVFYGEGIREARNKP